VNAAATYCATTHGPQPSLTQVDPARQRPTLAIIGAGRCGTALATAAHRAGYRITAVHSRTPANARRLAGMVGASCQPTAQAAVRSADITFLTVPDAAITRVAATVAAASVGLRGKALVHCSGSSGRSVLGSVRQLAARVGAVHPLQALSDADSSGALEGTFFAVDADEALAPVLEAMVSDIGGIAFTAPSGDRALYHAAAVLAGNAPLALLATASSLLERSGVDGAIAGEALAVLLEGAARNARRLGAKAALTGPVVRNDAATVARHLEALRGDQATQRLYQRMAMETLRTVGVVGREDVAAVLTAPSSRAAAPASQRRRARDSAAAPVSLGSRLSAA
jgi:predicted short-subunit dehydrogenase-like oxidoreductase (DUF2520 family)